MSLTTLETPDASLALAATAAASDDRGPAPQERPPENRPMIGGTARGRLFLKCLPAFGLAWAWMLQGTEWAAAGFGTWTGFTLLSTLLLAAACDMATRKIPNAITYPAFVWLAGSAIAREAIGYFGTDPTGGAVAPAAARWIALIGGPPLVEQLVGASACFAIMFFLFLFTGTGGGDVKLATVIGMAIGLSAGVAAIVATHIVGGCYGLCWAVAKFGPWRVVVGFCRLIGSFVLPLWIAPPSEAERELLKSPMPMGASFVVGTIFAIYQFTLGRGF